MSMHWTSFGDRLFCGFDHEFCWARAFVLGIAGRRCANARAELESEVRSEKCCSLSRSLRALVIVGSDYFLAVALDARYLAFA